MAWGLASYNELMDAGVRGFLFSSSSTDLVKNSLREILEKAN